MSDSDSDSDYDGGDGGGTSSPIQRCLATIGIDAAQDLSRCTNLTEEFTAIKRAYFKKILVVHPDKGGDAAEFRDVNSSWELIRKLYEDRAVESFVTAAESTQDRFDYDYGDKDSSSNTTTNTSSGGMPWQYYYDAAAEEVPPYKVELARSGRSKCNGTKSARTCSVESPFIGKGEIRIGSMDAMSGSYGRWIHLECWRVPNRIWQGLPQDGGDGIVARCLAALSGMNEVQFTGFNDLSLHHQHQIAAHVADMSNWASLRGRRLRPADLAASSTGGGGGGDWSSGSQPPARGASYWTGGYSGGSSSTAGYSTGGYSGGSMIAPSSGAAMDFMDHEESALVAPSAGQRSFYVVPHPGVNGARVDALKGKTIVMTGVFPEIGGGMGLNQGKDRLKSMCESFGARVRSAVSGKTDLLIVGKEPGASKVGKASASGKCQLVSLADLTLTLQGTQQLESAPPPEIESFSSGYYGNGLGRIKSSGKAQKVFMASQAPKTSPDKEAPAKKAPAKKKPPAKKKTPAKKAPAKKRAPAKKAAAKRTAAKAKPKPKAKKSAAAKKTASGTKKGSTTAAKANTPKAKKPATAKKKSTASGRKKITAAETASSTGNRRATKKAKVAPGS